MRIPRVRPVPAAPVPPGSVTVHQDEGGVAPGPDPRLGEQLREVRADLAVLGADLLARRERVEVLEVGCRGGVVAGLEVHLTAPSRVRGAAVDARGRGGGRARRAVHGAPGHRLQQA